MLWQHGMRTFNHIYCENYRSVSVLLRLILVSRLINESHGGIHRHEYHTMMPHCIQLQSHFPKNLYYDQSYKGALLSHGPSRNHMILVTENTILCCNMTFNFSHILCETWVSWNLSKWHLCSIIINGSNDGFHRCKYSHCVVISHTTLIA
jgi:hypothetical protein